MSHLFPRTYDSWRIGDAEREALEVPGEFEPEPYALCSKCHEEIDDEALDALNTELEAADWEDRDMIEESVVCTQCSK